MTRQSGIHTQLTQIDVALSLLLLYPLPSEGALKMARAFLLAHQKPKQSEAYCSLLWDYYAFFLNPSYAYGAQSRRKLNNRIKEQEGRLRIQLHGRIKKQFLDVSEYLQNVDDVSEIYPTYKGYFEDNVHPRLDKRLKYRRLKIDYYLESTDTPLSPGAMDAIRKFFSLPYETTYRFRPFDEPDEFEETLSYSLIPPLASVTDIVNAEIIKAVYLHNRVVHDLYIFVSTDGVPDNSIGRNFKEALKVFVDANSYGKKNADASEEILAYHQRRCGTSMSGGKWHYYLLFGKMLSTTATVNPFLYRNWADLASGFSNPPRKSQPGNCPVCGHGRQKLALTRAYCPRCDSYATDHELNLEAELLGLLVKLYPNELERTGIEKIQDSTLEKFREERKEKGRN